MITRRLFNAGALASVLPISFGLTRAFAEDKPFAMTNDISLYYPEGFPSVFPTASELGIMEKETVDINLFLTNNMKDGMDKIINVDTIGGKAKKTLSQTKEYYSVLDFYDALVVGSRYDKNNHKIIYRGYAAYGPLSLGPEILWDNNRKISVKNETPYITRENFCRLCGLLKTRYGLEMFKFKKAPYIQAVGAWPIFKKYPELAGAACYEINYYDENEQYRNMYVDMATTKVMLDVAAKVPGQDERTYYSEVTMKFRRQVLEGYGLKVNPPSIQVNMVTGH